MRDTQLLASLAERPKTALGGKEMYENIFKKAAVYLESLVRYHVFIDGNKRTAIAVSARFLFLNSDDLNAANREIERFVLDVARKKPPIAEIAIWLRRHTQKISHKK